MNTIMKLGTAAFAAALLSAAVPGAASAADMKCNGLSGYYGGVTAIIVGQDGRTVNVILDNGRPNAYGTCQGNQLTVNFTDDRTYTGTFDGRKISWSNGTSWTKK